jgi:6-methylpretetramide 4-monooxygenase / 4-hydroxy-6-methylpretetramide 12a-monooxygenase
MSSMGANGAAEVPVLIIGAGPSGLFAAVELARHGVPARVVEREPVPPRQARATALQPGTLEILAQAGVLDRILDASVRLEFARVFDAALRPLAETSFAGTGCPWAFECSLPQWRTEQILAERLAELGGTVQRGVSAVSIRERDDGVLVELARPDGSRELVKASWVIGAGGAHSLTRESMAESMAGATYPGTALVADVEVSCGLPRDGSALIASAAGYMLLAPLPGDRWITFVGDLDDDEAQRLARDTSVDAVADSIQRRVGSAVRMKDVGWASAFRMHKRAAPSLADRRRFLLGDAGHLSSPFGGEGLNSGVHDAHNLAWKLALELRGRARPILLESFASERGSAARHVLAVSDRLHAMAHGAVESARTGVFPPPPAPEQSAALIRSRSMLDVSYGSSPLTSEYRSPGEHGSATPAPGERYPDRARLAGTAHHLLIFDEAGDASLLDRLHGRWAGLVEVVRVTGDPRTRLAGDGAVLVRPDGQVGFRADAADVPALRALDAHLDSYLVSARAPS